MNINDQLTVTLTAAGAGQYNAAHAEFWALYPQYSKPLAAGDVLKTEMWQLMQTFGPVCANGSPPPFERCEVLTAAEIAERRIK